MALNYQIKRKILGKKLTKDIKFNELFKPLHFN